MQSGGLVRTCSFIWLWSSVKARGHTSWELMTCIPREFSLLKSAVHFELLVLLFLLLVQFLLYKWLWSFKLYILHIFLLFVCSGIQALFLLEKCCALWVACAAVLPACSVPSKPGMQNWKVPFLWVFIIAKNSVSCIYFIPRDFQLQNRKWNFAVKYFWL